MKALAFVAILAAACAVAFWLFQDDGNMSAGRGSSDGSSATRGEGAAPTLEAVGVPDPAQAQPVPALTTRSVDEGVRLTVSGAGGLEVAEAIVLALPDRNGTPWRRIGDVRTWRLSLPATLPVFERSTWLEVWHPKGADGAALPLASALHGPFPKTQRAIDLQLPAAQAIRGRVVSSEGRAVGGVRVVAVHVPAPHSRWASHGEVTTDEQGMFVLGGLRKATYRLETWPVGRHAAADQVTVEAPQEDVLVELKPGFIAEVTVLDPDDRPVQGIDVRVGATVSRGTMTLGTDAATGTTNQAGTVRLEALDPTKVYLLEVKTSWKREDVVPHTEWSWKPRSHTVRLRRSLEVRGRCQTEDGSAFPHASVHVSPKDVRVFLPEGHAKDDGRWVVGRVPEGPVSVRASRGRGLERWRSARVAAQAGDTDVVLVMTPDPIGDVTVRIEGWPGGAEPAHAYLVGETEGRPADNAGPSTPVGPDGSVRFRKVRLRGTYTFFAATPDGAHCAYRNTIVPGTEPTVVWLRTAASLRGRIARPDGVESLQVYVTGRGVTRGGPVADDGEFQVTGLPEGQYKLGVSARVDGKHYYRTYEVRTGDTLDLAIEAADEGGR